VKPPARKSRKRDQPAGLVERSEQVIDVDQRRVAVREGPTEYEYRNEAGNPDQPAQPEHGWNSDRARARAQAESSSSESEAERAGRGPVHHLLQLLPHLKKGVRLAGCSPSRRSSVPTIARLAHLDLK